MANELTLAAEKIKVELEIVNRQLLLAGELNLKYQERLEDLQLHRRSDAAMEMMEQAFQHEIKGTLCCCVFLIYLQLLFYSYERSVGIKKYCNGSLPNESRTIGANCKSIYR